MIELILVIVGLVGLLIASYSDFETREIPNWLNFGLIGAGLGLRAIGSIATKDPMFLIAGVAGFLIMAVIGQLLYYSKQWGGGDTKLLMAVGAIFGTMPSSPWFLAHFLVNLIVVGAVYGLAWSVYLAIRYFRGFFRELKKTIENTRVQIRVFCLVGLLLMLCGGMVTEKKIAIILITVGSLAIVYIFLMTFVRTVEGACMYRRIRPENLTEGDWIAHDVIFKKQKIYSFNEPGVSKAQITLMKKFKIPRVTVKDGIPFVPSFLLAMIVTLVVGNIFRVLI